jgi:redox-sensitive bicupin YhaK (pirin superfamily)
MGAISRIIEARTRDVGGFEVGRVLPAGRMQSVGPFIFFDRMGPADFPAGQGIDVKPHPHIGLATVTYLFEGELLHRDSLGSVQPVRPGDVNWMIAGRGIVHSERTAPEVRAAPSTLHGIQSWLALPREEEERAPQFAHHPGDTLPMIESDGVRLTLIAGEAMGMRSPVCVVSPTLYLDALLAPGGEFILPDEHEERAVYAVSGDVRIDAERLGSGSMAVLAPGCRARVAAPGGARLMVLGGDALDGERHIWWNFVSSEPGRIERAKDDWRAGRFDPVPGDGDSTPLPGD